MGLLWIGGCQSVAWQDERVLGADVAAIQIEGSVGSAMGSVVSIGSQGLLVGAEGTGQVLAFDLDGTQKWCVDVPNGVGMRLGWTESGVWIWSRGMGYRFLDESGQWMSEVVEQSATNVARCPDGSFAEVHTPGASVVCEEEGRIWTVCADDVCEVFREQENVGRTSAGSAVAWIDEQACWGDVQLNEPDASGAVLCEDGWNVQGLQGEHLGTAIAGDRVAGQFSKWLVPARARVLGVSGQTTWSVEHAAERSRLSLSYYDGTYAVGVPGALGQSAQQGRVYLLRTED